MYKSIQPFMHLRFTGTEEEQPTWDQSPDVVSLQNAGALASACVPQPLLSSFGSPSAKEHHVIMLMNMFLWVAYIYR